METIANLKKSFVIQIVVVWKPCAECPGDGENAGQETYLLNTYYRITRMFVLRASNICELCMFDQFANKICKT